MSPRTAQLASCCRENSLQEVPNKEVRPLYLPSTLFLSFLSVSPTRLQGWPFNSSSLVSWGSVLIIALLACLIAVPVYYGLSVLLTGRRSVTPGKQANRTDVPTFFVYPPVFLGASPFLGKGKQIDLPSLSPSQLAASATYSL